MTFLQKSIKKVMLCNRFVKEGKAIEKALVSEFKRLTGFNGGDIAKKYGVSRQFVHQELSSNTLTHKASSAFFLNAMINEKVLELKKQVRDLEFLQLSIEGSVTNGEDKHE